MTRISLILMTSLGTWNWTSQAALGQEGPVVRAYDVGDLIQPDREGKLMEDQLLEVIVKVGPAKSWEGNGGPGTLQYFALGNALVVYQKESVHHLIVRKLKALRVLHERGPLLFQPPVKQ